MKLGQKLAIKYVRATLHMLALVSKRKAAKKALKLFSTPMPKGKTKAPAIFSKGERLSFNLDGLTIRGHRWLPKQTPLKRVLICHGFESNTRKFSAYISAFIKKGYEVLAFDAPAHGGSDGKQITLPLYIDMITEINEHFGPIQSFMGHSLGGIAIAHFLETSLHNEETRSALIAPVTETKTAIANFFHFLDLDEETREEFDALIFEKTGKPQEYFSVCRAMHQIDASVLWIHDEEDQITSIRDVMKAKEDCHPNIKFLFTKGLGHTKIYRDEEVVRQVVDWL